jgi:hypothetical protein
MSLIEGTNKKPTLEHPCQIMKNHKIGTQMEKIGIEIISMTFPFMVIQKIIEIIGIQTEDRKIGTVIIMIAETITTNTITEIKITTIHEIMMTIIIRGRVDSLTITKTQKQLETIMEGTSHLSITTIEITGSPNSRAGRYM